MNILTQDNNQTHIHEYQWHMVPLPQCCPVSGNPQPGSFLLILYRPDAYFLEVYSLRQYVHRFVGGFGSVRDMEGMLQQIAMSCADSVNVRVILGAYVRLQHGDDIRIFMQGDPQ